MTTQIGFHVVWPSNFDRVDGITWETRPAQLLILNIPSFLTSNNSKSGRKNIVMPSEWPLFNLLAG